MKISVWCASVDVELLKSYLLLVVDLGFANPDFVGCGAGLRVANCSTELVVMGLRLIVKERIRTIVLGEVLRKIRVILFTSTLLLVIQPTTSAFAARPSSNQSCDVFFKSSCEVILERMISSFALIGLVTSPFHAFPGCDPGQIERLAIDLSMVQKTAVPALKDDPRYGMHEGAEIAGLTPEEAKEMAEVTGKVTCPLSSGKDWIIGDATLVGDTAEFIATNAHLAVGTDGNSRLPRHSECYFSPTRASRSTLLH